MAEIAYTDSHEIADTLLELLGMKLDDLVTKVEIVFEVTQPVVVRVESLITPAQAGEYLKKIAEYRLVPNIERPAAPTQE
jgi:hypothetical protein